jgi:hypothetical protein
MGFGLVALCHSFLYLLFLTIIHTVQSYIHSPFAEACLHKYELLSNPNICYMAQQAIRLFFSYSTQFFLLFFKEEPWISFNISCQLEKFFN